MKIYLKGLLAAGLLTALLLGLWFYYDANVEKPSEGNPLQILDQLETRGVPEFSLPDMTGQIYKSESLKGQIVVLNFWATWCPPCVAEFPSMLKMVDHFGGSVKLVTIAADEKKDDIERFVNALKLKSPHWVSLWDPEQVVAKKFGTGRLPETYILNKDAKLVKKVVNALDWSSDPVIKYLEELRAK